MIHVLDQRHQLGTFVADARFAGLHFFKPILRRLDRCMWCVIGEVHKERAVFALAIIDVVDTPFGNQVGRVAGRIDLKAVLSEIIDTVPTMLVIVVDHVAEETLEMIETAIVRYVRFLKAKVPFTDKRSVITSPLECPGQKRCFL